jgi:hypothetical protein
METRHRVLVFGDTHLLRRLAAALRISPRLDVLESRTCDEIKTEAPFQPELILVDAAQVTPEQFHELLDCAPASRSILVSIDPLTYQLTVLSSPPCARPLAQIARVIEILSVSLPEPA